MPSKPQIHPKRFQDTWASHQREMKFLGENFKDKHFHTADISGTGGLAPPIKHLPLVLAIVGWRVRNTHPVGEGIFDSQKLKSKL